MARCRDCVYVCLPSKRALERQGAYCQIPRPRPWWQRYCRDPDGPMCEQGKLKGADDADED